MSFKQWDRKGVNDIYDFTADWSKLIPAGDAIATSTWTIPAALTKSNEGLTPTTTTLRLSGGLTGASYQCVNRIVTVQGRQYERTVVLPVGTV